MKVKEFIELLQKEDPEMRVVISGYEGGYLDIEQLDRIKLKLFVNKESYYGPHEEVWDYEKDAECDEIALRII